MFMNEKIEMHSKIFPSRFQLFTENEWLYSTFTFCCHMYEGNHCDTCTRGSLGSQTRSAAEIFMSSSFLPHFVVGVPWSPRFLGWQFSHQKRPVGSIRSAAELLTFALSSLTGCRRELTKLLQEC